MHAIVRYAPYALCAVRRAPRRGIDAIVGRAQGEPAATSMRVHDYAAILLAVPRVAQGRVRVILLRVVPPVPTRVDAVDLEALQQVLGQGGRER